MDHTVSMNNLVNSDGRHNLFGWIIFIGTVALIAYSLYQGYKAITKMEKEEDVQEKKMKEIELNLRMVMGDRYQIIN